MQETNPLAVPASCRTLGSALVWARSRRSASLRDVAAAVGVSAAFLSDVERGRRGLSPDVRGRLARHLGLEEAGLEARSGWGRDLAEWVAADPDVVRVLREAMLGGRRIALAPVVDPIPFEPTREQIAQLSVGRSR